MNGDGVGLGFGDKMWGQGVWRQGRSLGTGFGDMEGFGDKVCGDRLGLDLGRGQGPRTGCMAAGCGVRQGLSVGRVYGDRMWFGGTVGPCLRKASRDGLGVGWGLWGLKISMGTHREGWGC